MKTKFVSAGLIGAVIVLVTILVFGAIVVILLLPPIGDYDGVGTALADAYCAKLNKNECGSVVPDRNVPCVPGDCVWGSVENRCTAKPRAQRSGDCFQVGGKM